MSVENEKKNGTNGFLFGVFLLSLSTFAVKVIGLFFKIPMLSLLGADGMGYFNSAYEIYALLCIISTAGLPVALSMLVSSARTSGDAERIKKVYASAFSLFFVFGFVGSVAMLCFAPFLGELIGNRDAVYCIAAIAPSLFFVCLSSAQRGYCQGFENMLPTALSQLIEALCKLFLGLIFAYLAKDAGLPLPKQAGAAVLGITTGSFLSFCYLVIAKQRIRLPEKNEVKHVRGRGITKELVSIALPITLSSAVLGVSRVVDMALIMRRLPNGEAANSIYGAYTTLAVPVFALMPALITPIAMATVPRLSSLIAQKDAVGQRNTAERSIGLTVMLSLPASMALCAFSYPILNLLFSGREQDVAIAAPLLACLGPAVLFSCLITTENGILQAYRHTVLPIISMMAGVAVKIASSYFLIGREDVGIYGAPIGSLLCNITVAFVNFLFIADGCKLYLRTAKLMLPPLGAAFISIGGAYLLFVFLCEKMSEKLLFLLCTLIAVVVYFAILKLFGGIDEEYISCLPFGKKLLQILSKKENKEV